MKQLLEFNARFKVLTGLIFSITLLIYVIINIIVGVYSVHFITLLGLLLFSGSIAILKILIENREGRTSTFDTLLEGMKLFIIIGLCFLYNEWFSFFQLEGIHYLYFLLLIIFCDGIIKLSLYLAASYDIHILNVELSKKKNNK